MRLLLSRKRQQWKKATPQKKCKYENHIENYYNFGYFYHQLQGISSQTDISNLALLMI